MLKWPRYYGSYNKSFKAQQNFALQNEKFEQTKRGVKTKHDSRKILTLEQNGKKLSSLISQNIFCFGI